MMFRLGERVPVVLNALSLWRLRDGVLAKISILYVALPWLIFVAGWLRIPFMILFGVGLVGGILVFFQDKDSKSGDFGGLTPAIVALVLVVAFFWTRLSGAGGFGLQNWDWLKHNTILKDLIYYPWPVGYLKYDGTRWSLDYYLAYYLPSALIGKIFGWRAAHLAIFWYSYIGGALTLLWFARLVGRYRFLAVLFFILFGGFDYVGHWIFRNYACGGTEIMEYWLGYIQCHSNSHHFFWAPHHALSGWIITAMIVNQVIFRLSGKHVFFLLALTALWSPFITIGLVPIVLCGFYHVRFRGVFEKKALLFPLVVLGLAWLYFSAHSPSIPRGWLPKLVDLYSFWPTLVLYYLLSFGLYLYFLPRRSMPGTDSELWYWCIAATLVFLPWYRMGNYWDLNTQAAIPAKFLLCLMLARSILSLSKTGTRKVLLLLSLIGFFPGCSVISRSHASRAIGIPSLHWTPTIMSFPESWAIHQYLGHPEAFFFKRIARPLFKDQPIQRSPRSFEKDENILIDAESYMNGVVERPVQSNASAHGGAVIAAGDKKDALGFLKYSFSISSNLSPRMIRVLYMNVGPPCFINMTLNGDVLGETKLGTTSNAFFQTHDIFLGEISRGTHTLTVKISGEDLLLDAFLITDSSKSEIILEAENHSNQTRLDHAQAYAAASGGKFIGNYFGQEERDRLDFIFDVKTELPEPELTLAAITLFPHAKLAVGLDGTNVAHLAIPVGESWIDFSDVRSQLPPLSRGSHRLSIQSQGVNVNVDFLRIGKRRASGFLIEAEKYENPTRENHITPCPLASRREIVSRDFGVSPNDRLKYSFETTRESQEGLLRIAYATALDGAVYEVFLNGKSTGKIPLENTGDWWLFQEKSVPINGLKNGKSTLEIKGNGVKVNIDYFIVIQN